MKRQKPYSWVPTLYFAEALPYVAVMTISVILYKRMGITNTDIALYTGWLYLPWVIKPFWSPFVELFRHNRWWIITTQLIVGLALAGVALTIPTSLFFRLTLAFFWLMAFTSATHDIAADGFYIQALDSHDQSFYVGIRSTFYRLATLFGQGVLVIVAGLIETNTGLDPTRLTVHVDPACTAATVSELPEPNTGDDRQQRVVFSQTDLLIAASASSADSLPASALIADLKERVISHNQAHHFVTLEEGKKAAAATTAELSGLEHWIRDTFGEQTAKSACADNKTPNVAVVGVRLAQAPKANENVTLQLSLDEGDKSIAIDESAFIPRFTFDASNWDKTAYFLIKTDPNIQEATTATFVATSGSITLAWAIVFAILSVLFLVLCLYHSFVLPHPHLREGTESAEVRKTPSVVLREFWLTLKSFFSRPQIAVALLFMLLFRFPEAQLVKLAQPFMLDSVGQGGLGLTTGQVGFVYGTVGMIGLTLGGILGGFVVAKGGLRRWLWPMVLSISLPDLVYVWLSYTQNNSLLAVNTCVFIEQFGYGFGFTAYMLYLIYFSRGERSTSIYAICTAFMALGMMLPGMMAGWLEDLIGYKHFFVWVMICCIVTVIVSALLKIDPTFGKKEEKE